MDLSELGRQFGLDPQQTQAAIDALAPVVAAGIRRNSQDDGGLADLIGALAKGSHGQYIDEPALLDRPETIDEGNAILGHVFGSKDISRGVAQQLSASSGIGAAVLKKLLPIVAAMVMGQLAKKSFGGAPAPAPAPKPAPSGPSLEDILGQVLGGGAAKQAPSGGLGDILGDILGGGRQGSPASPKVEDVLKDLFERGGAPEPTPVPQRQQRIEQGRRTLDDILGGGTRSGNAADDLLNSVERHVRRR